jgi:hypothetical protein
LIQELLLLGRAEVARAYVANLLADALAKIIFPTAARLTSVVAEVCAADPEIPADRLTSIVALNPSLPDVLGQLQEVLADIQDAWAAFQLLGSWQPASQGPTSAARLRRNAPADAWAEETVSQSIIKAEARIAATRGRVAQFVGILRAQSKAYGERVGWPAVTTHPPLRSALQDAAQHTGGLANLLTDYARVWGVPLA